MGEITEKSFESVKAYVVGKYPEFENISLEPCDECENDYQESKEERAEEGMEPRVFAHSLHKPFIICYNERMDEELSEAERQGILVHEFGHLYDVRHAEELAGFDDPEMRADLIAFSKFRVPINYEDGRDIQTIELPIGSEEVNDEDAIAILEDIDEELSSEELEEILNELEEEDDENEDDDEFNLNLPESFSPVIEKHTDILDNPLNAPILEPDIIEPEGHIEHVVDDKIQDAELDPENNEP